MQDPCRAAQQYEKAIAKVGTIADTQEVPLGTLSQQIMELSNKTGIAANAIADDVYNAISAGQKTGDAVNFVTNSTKLAKAGFAESSQTLDVLTTVLNAYGMSADKVSTVSDMLVQTQNKGKVTVGELASSMGKIIPTANASNVSLEQLCACTSIILYMLLMSALIRLLAVADLISSVCKLPQIRLLLTSYCL